MIYFNSSHTLRIGPSLSVFIGTINKTVIMNCITERSLSLNPILTADKSELSTVLLLHLLGVIFRKISRGILIEERPIAKKYCLRFLIIRNLKRACCPPLFIHKFHVLFIHAVLLHMYSFSCLCNLPYYVFYRMYQVEKVCI